MGSTEIIVGIDGSAPGRAAMQWAAAEAQRRGASLHVLMAYHWRWPGARFAVSAELEAMVNEQVGAVLEDEVTRVRALYPDLTVSETLVLGSPSEVLIDASRHAAMTVVGNRGHGGFASLLLGSVGEQVATHAHGPVVVVRGRADTATGPVVVGVDDSSGADMALGVAFEQASERQCNLIAIRVHREPMPPVGMDIAPRAYYKERVEDDHRKALQESVAAWRTKFPSVAVEELVACGSPGTVLTEVSGSAGLIVVGSRGRGPMAGTMLGSVGLTLLHHAACPVLVVRERLAQTTDEH